MKTLRAPLFLALLGCLLVVLACERVKTKPAENPAGEPAGAMDTPPAPTPPTAEPAPTPPGPPTTGPRPSPQEPKGTYYFKVNFPVMRGLAVMQANASRFRELAVKQGFLGKLIACGADPFTTLDHLTAVLPPQVRKNPGGAVTIQGQLDPAKVMPCLEGELKKDGFEPAPEGKVRWLKSPRLSVALSSPGAGQVRGVSRGWDKLDLPAELAALEKRLPGNHALLLGAEGDILPVASTLKYTLLSFAPAGDALEVRGLLLFGSPTMAASIAKMITGTLAARRQAAEQHPDPKLRELGSRLLGRWNVQATGAEVSLDAKIPYTELVEAVGLFSVQVKGTF